MDDFFRPNLITSPFYIGEGIVTALVNGRDSDDLVSGGACNGMRNSLTDSPMQWTHYIMGAM